MSPARRGLLTGFLGGALAVLVLGGTGLAIAAIPSSKTGTYTGCVNDKTGVLRVINAQASKKCASKTEKTITWSQRGPVGLPGGTGPQGPQGIQGPKGDAGAQGPQGNANVTSTVVTLTSADFAWSSNYSWSTGPLSYTEYFTRYHDIAVPAITQAVLDSGSVEVFFTPRKDIPNTWVPLPFSIDSSFGFTDNYAIEVSLGQVRVHFFYVAQGNTTTPTLSTATLPTLKYKVIVTGGS